MKKKKKWSHHTKPRTRMGEQKRERKTFQMYSYISLYTEKKKKKKEVKTQNRRKINILLTYVQRVITIRDGEIVSSPGCQAVRWMPAGSSTASPRPERRCVQWRSLLFGLATRQPTAATARRPEGENMDSEINIKAEIYRETGRWKGSQIEAQRGRGAERQGGGDRQAGRQTNIYTETEKGGK